jgi:ABC-type dipeptide/oligopeptide/nickel transport system permease component
MEAQEPTSSAGRSPYSIGSLLPTLTSNQRSLLRSLMGILSFVIQRLVFGAVVLLFIIFLSYLGIKMASGTSFGPASSQAIESTGRYVSRLAHGDLGLTTTGSETLLPRPVTTVVAERLPRSLALLGLSLFFASIVGIPLGILAARGRGERSVGILISTLIGISIPSFFAAFLLQWAITAFTRAAGYRLLPVGGFGWDNHIILPMVVLAARPIAQITRVTFLAVRDTLAQDYIRTAASKGINQLRIMTVHVMKNAAIPILTTIGVSLRFALSSLPVVELYFGWPGAGFSLLKSIAQQDDNLTVALALSLGLLFILVNLLLDLSYRLIDPRLLKRPDFVSAGQRFSVIDLLKQMLAEIRDLLVNNAFVQRLRKSVANGAKNALDLPAQVDLASRAANAADEQWEKRERQSLKLILKNFPFVLGSILVLGLLAVVLFGPYMAPNSPFQTQRLVRIDGQLTPPPFAPNETYPWGTDALGRGMLSLILAGAQQTLVLGMLVVVARTAVGILLGTLAGWSQGSLLDRTILSLAEIISAFPTLLIAMILILAIGIRLGMQPFIIALCFVGWGEIMQFVRGEVISIRPKLFIESAVALGARSPRIVVRHILPNLLPSLISLTAIEMGAVLMLLGELGFIGIFIGGGSLIELPSMAVLYSDVPEWGALLSNIRFQARSYPWTALYPMLAFFVSIVGFNLFGEGLRRLIAEGSLVINRIFNRYTLILGAAVILGMGWYRDHSGALAFYRQQAGEFSAAHAMEYERELSAPEFMGRALGTPGMDQAAEYLAGEFEALGLQPAGEADTYFQTREHAYGKLNGLPEFTIYDDGPGLIYGQDFAAYPGRNMSGGQGSGPVRFVSLGESSPTTVLGRIAYPELDTADFSGQVLLVLSDREASLLAYRNRTGMLVVTDDPEKLARHYTLSGRSGRGHNYLTGESWGTETPAIWISEETAERILAGSGYSLNDLRHMSEELGVEELFELPLSKRVAIDMKKAEIEETQVQHVLGYLPGKWGIERCTTCLDVKLIVLMAQYDTPPTGYDGEAFEAANDNASGVAVMLETIRTMQESGYQPYKTFLFIAYSGEGLDGGEPTSDPDIRGFLQARTGFTNFEVEAIIHLRGLGAGSGDRLEVSAGGSLRLAELFERSAKQMGTAVGRAKEGIDISQIYDEGSTVQYGGQEAPEVRLHWEGWQKYSRTSADRMDVIRPRYLEDSGRAVTLALMVLGRETEY